MLAVTQRSVADAEANDQTRQGVGHPFPVPAAGDLATSHLKAPLAPNCLPSRRLRQDLVGANCLLGRDGSLALQVQPAGGFPVVE